MKKIKITTALLLTCLTLLLKAQVSIVNIQLTPYNITPDAMMAVSIMNNGDAQQMQLVSRLYNFNNELLLTVTSSSFTVKQGMNAAFDGGRKVSSAIYTSGKQSEYIKVTNGLPSGTFKVCIDIIKSQATEPSDQFCDELESDFNQYLYLVYPADKDVIDTKTPLLTWTHSEPFSVLTQGESYRMVVTEMKDKQGAEEAVTVNSPLMLKNFLTIHSLQYPYDAKELTEGGHYAWQVQKIANGVITNKTEAWEFSIDKKPEDKELKYVALRQVLDGSYYTTYSGKIYFKFNEDYNSKGSIIAFIRSEKGKEFPVEINKDEKVNKNAVSKIKSTGDNRFVLDLDKQNLSPGYYVMEIRNEKKETYYLKFYFSE